MPTYEYRCPSGHEFELFQRMSDEPRAPCPQCGEEAARLLSSGAGFLFRGDGFYITDYRSDDYRKAAKSETGDKGSGSGSGQDAGGGVGGDKAGSGAGSDKAGSDSATPAPRGAAAGKSSASKESGPSAAPAATSKPSPGSPGGTSGSS